MVLYSFGQYPNYKNILYFLLLKETSLLSRPLTSYIFKQQQCSILSQENQ